LQHQDGASHVVAATVPNCRAYDPAFAYELSVILDHGLREMLTQGDDVFYYVTVMNESYAQPSMPPGVEDAILRGLHRVREVEGSAAPVRLVASGAMVRETLEAATLLVSDWSIDAEVWSATSYSELAREARSVERWNRLHPEAEPRTSHLADCLAGTAPIVALSDYVRAYPGLIAGYLDAPLTLLGTDGFGRSDTRKKLRRFFEIDRFHIVVAALSALARTGAVDRSLCARAIARYGVAGDEADPWSR
jgi:pyruvate dehydrogenase E1 component